VPLLVACLMAGGLAWLTMMSCMSVAVQSAAPAWVRARALGIYLLVFQGLMAVGSLAWGTLAERFGNSAALALAALALVGGLAAIRRWPLHPIERLNLAPSRHWPEPKLAITPEPDAGPVLVTVEYRVPAERAEEFIQAMQAMRSFRHKDGAISWGVFRDLAEPDRYLETFLIASWAEHMRQHARVTVTDQAIEAHAFSFLQAGVEPVAAHLIAAHPGDSRPPAEPPDAERP
jgi:MFS family permease